MIKHPMFACSENITEDMLDELFDRNEGEPIYVTDKMDGVRCVIDHSDGEVVALSRSLKLLPNMWVQKWADQHGIPGMDGEIMIPQTDFNDIQSFVMTGVTLPISWHYHLFDWWKGSGRPYLHRMQKAKAMVDMYAPAHTLVMMPIECRTPDEVMVQFRGAIRKGREGLILRRGDGWYKNGRSTRLEMLALKMKAYEDDEAQIIGFIPEYENRNEQKRNELGKAKRSSHKAGKVAKPMLGAFMVRHADGREFKVAGAMSREFKIYVWNHKREFLKQWLTYKWQRHGTKGKPRTPIFKGIRRD
jgi:DNA ligase-1